MNTPPVAPVVPLAVAPFETLAECRKHIDFLDQSLIRLLQERFETAHRVAHIKQASGIPVRIPERITAVLNHVADEAASHGVDPDLARSLWSLIIEATCQFEEAFLARGEAAAGAMGATNAVTTAATGADVPPHEAATTTPPTATTTTTTTGTAASAAASAAASEPSTPRS